MPGIRFQVTLSPATASALDRRSRNHPRGRSGFIAALCDAYVALFCRDRSDRSDNSDGSDVAGEVAEMFRIYTEAQAPDWGAVPVRKRSVRHE